jgi:hypothetical protein
VVISKKSGQMIYHEETCPYAKRMQKKYRRYISEQKALEKGYRPCSYCGGLHGIFLSFVDDSNDLTASYDKKDKALCFRTDVGFWKVLEQGDPKSYRLWHLNGSDFDQNVESKYLMRRSFHRQVDVKSTTNIGKIVQYIRDHDKAKKIIKDDWKKLPKSTQKQKRYYKQAKKREERKRHKRLDQLFEMIEKGKI